MKMSRMIAICVCLPLAIFLGCAQRSGTNQSTTFVEASRAKSYHSIHQLVSDAQAIVLLTATSSHSVDYVGPGHTPYTVTVATVDRVLRGSVGGASVQIRQIGSQGGPVVTDAVPLLEPGKSYVAFLQKFTFGPGRGTDQYVVVGGGAGLFADQSGNLTRLDPQSPDLPVRLSQADLQKLIAP